MKKSALMSLLLACLMVFPAQSQSTQNGKDFRYTVKVNPLAALGGPLYAVIVPLTGEYRVMFEAQTASRQSVEVGVSYLGPSLILNLDDLSADDSEIEGVKTSGYRAQAMYKFFLTKDKAPAGFYVGPHVSYATATIKNKSNSEDAITASKLNINAIFGYQLITRGGFALNVYTGLGFKQRNYDFPNETDFDFDYGNKAAANVAFGFSFGYAF